MKRVGFLADTHSMKADGSDLPDAVLDAFEGVDVIVHLGDVGRKGILERLSAVAPVLVPVGGNKGYVPVAGGADPVYVLESGKHVIGLAFNLAQPDKKIVVDDSITFPDAPLAPLWKRRFKRTDVDVVAFGGTHRQMEQRHDGILFLNPGSPTMPVDGAKAGVAVLRLGGARPEVDLISW